MLTSGTLWVAVPIVVNNFTMYYTHAKTRTKLPKASVKQSRRRKLIGHLSSNNLLERCEVSVVNSL